MKIDALLAASPVGVGMVDPSGRYIWLNEALALLMGRSVEEQLGCLIDDLFPTQEIKLAPLLRQVLTTHTAIEQLAIGVSPAGKQCLLTMYPIFATDERLEGIGLMVMEVAHPPIEIESPLIDIINKKNLELYQIQTQQLEAIFQNASVGLAVYDVSPEFRCLRHNRRFINLMGQAIRSKDSMVGIPLREILDHQSYLEALAICQHVANTGEVFSTDEYQAHMVSDPMPRWYSWNLAPLRDIHGVIVGLLVTASEITAQKQAVEERHAFELKLLEAQKLESLGVLAGTIAHDFNNILAIVLGNIELAICDLKANDHSMLMDYLLLIETATQQATDLARQILAYSGKGHFITQLININDLIIEMIELIKVSMNKQITLNYIPGPSVEKIKADPSQIRQVIMNLIINAADAIGDNKGTITVRTGYQKIDEFYVQFVNPNEVIEAESYIFIEISDTGSGIDPLILPKIFEPFFTTKSTGSGLGLAAVQGIMHKHHGFINISSKPGWGTTFTVLLPCTSQCHPSTPLLDVTDTWHASSTILIVDDELEVRQTIGKMLEKLNFTVVSASSGLEAIRMLKQNQMIQIVLLDLTMPGLDGKEALDLLYQHDPLLPVILMSGYMLNESIYLNEYKNLAGFLHKPFSFTDLKKMFVKIIS